VVPGLALGVEPATARHDRSRAAADLLETAGPQLRRVARRVSICADDAEDALQRALVLLLTKAPPIDGPRLAAWMTVVTRREALAVRRSRERFATAADSLDAAHSDRPGPAEHAERRERVAEAKLALAALKPAERLAIVLQAEGYSYAEICTLCGWSYTKLNRSLAEGRARLRVSGDATGGGGLASALRRGRSLQ
jgi:RNA polymerase sigma factor (sigma-70 family)